MNAIVTSWACVPLSQTLLHSLWQATALAVFGRAICWVLCRKSAEARYWMNLGTLMLMAVALAGTFVLLTPSESSLATSAKPAERPRPFERMSPDQVVPIVVPVPTGAPSSARGAHEPQPASWMDTFRSVPWERIAPYAAMAYLVGVSVMLLRLLGAVWGGRRLHASARQVADSEIIAMVRRQAAVLGVRCIPALLYCERVAVPMVIGIFRPMILLPMAVTTGLTADEVQAILTHELAHIRRLDPLFNVLQRVLEAVLFFNPAAWYVSRQVTIEREHCCDDLVVASGTARVVYAGSLARIAELYVRSRPNTVAALAVGGDRASRLRDRIERLLTGEQPRLRVMPRGFVGLALLLVASIAAATAVVASGENAPPAMLTVPEQVTTLRQQLADVQQQIEKLREPAYKKDAFLLQADRDRSEVASKVQDAKRVLEADRLLFGKSGQGDASLFARWQHEYGEYVDLTIGTDHALSDPRVRPYVLRFTKETFKGLDPKHPPAEFEAVRDLLPADSKDLTPERVLELMRTANLRRAGKLRSNLDVLEKKVRPTELNRIHVADYHKLLTLETYATMYQQLNKPAELIALEGQEAKIINQLNGVRNTPAPGTQAVTIRPGATFEIYRIAPAKTPNTVRAINPETGKALFLQTPPILTTADIGTVTRTENEVETEDDTQSEQTQPALNITLTPAGAVKMAKATAAPNGETLAVVINGRVIATPKILSPIQGSFQISGGSSVTSAIEALTKTEHKDSQGNIRTWTAILVDASTRSPLPGITVEVKGAKKGQGEQQLMTLTSNVAGRVEIPLATGQATSVEVRTPGWWKAGLSFVGDMSALKTSDGKPVFTTTDGKPLVFDPTKPVSIDLWKGTVVKGQLLAPDRTPAVGVALKVGVYINNMEWKKRLGMDLAWQSWDHGEWPNWEEHVVTSKDGSFSTTVPPSDARGWVRVGTGELGFQSIDPTGLEENGPFKALVKYAPLEYEVQDGLSDDPAATKPKNPLDLGTLKLQRGVVLKGRVVDAQGNPLAGVLLLTSGRRGPYAGRSATSNRDGSFAFLPMSPGTINLEPEARLRNEKGEVISRDVRAVFVSQKVTIPDAGDSLYLNVQAVSHVNLEFEWVDRRAKKGPVSYYGGFTVYGRVPHAGHPTIWWRGETERTTRGGRDILSIKVPATITGATLGLPADETVTPGYRDDQIQSGPGDVSLGDVTKPRRRVIYGDEPQEAMQRASIDKKANAERDETQGAERVSVLASGVAPGEKPTANPRRTDARTGPAVEKKTDVPDQITISGTCVDENDKPIAAARVRLFFVDIFRAVDFYAPRSQRQLQDVRTDKHGRFRFVRVEAKELREKRAMLTLAAQSPGKATALQHVFQDKYVDTSFELKLLAAATLRGRVTDANGKPVAGAVVDTSWGFIEPIPGIRSAVTDAEGRYEITDGGKWPIAQNKIQPLGDGVSVSYGAPTYWVRHPDYARQPFSLSRVPDTVDITLKRRADVAGQVVLAETGQPVAKVTVEFSSIEPMIGPDWWTRATTDAQGRYRLEILPPGRYKVTVGIPHHPVYAATVELKVGKNSHDVQIKKGGVIKGRVIDVTTKKPIVLAPGDMMQLSQCARQNGGWYGGSNHADVGPDGTFTLRIPAGKVHFAMYFGKKWRGVNTDQLLEEGVSVAEGQTVDVEIRVKPLEETLQGQKFENHESKVIEKIESLGGKIERDDKLPDRPIIGVDFRKTNFLSNDELRLLKAFKKLTTLRFNRMNDGGLKEVGQLKNLKELEFYHPAITDAGLKELKGLNDLASLELIHSRITGSGLKELWGLTNLTKLHLGMSAVTDDGLKALAGFKNLTELSLARTRISRASLEHVRGLKDLKKLYLDGTSISDAGLRDLDELQNLKELGLGGTRITDAGLEELSKLQDLTNLSLSDTAVTDAGLRELRQHKQLTFLDLSNTKIKDDAYGLTELRDLKKLTHLNLWGTEITEQALERLVDFHNLTELNLDGTQVTDEGLLTLRHLQKLTTLTLNQTQITDAGLNDLSQLRSLRVLYLPDTISDAGLKKLKRSLPATQIGRSPDPMPLHAAAPSENTPTGKLGKKSSDSGTSEKQNLTSKRAPATASKLEQVYKGASTLLGVPGDEGSERVTLGKLPARAADEIRLLEEAEQDAQQTFAKIKKLFMDGAKGGEAEKHAQSGYALLRARARVAWAKGDARATVAQLERAVKFAVRFAEAAESAYQAETVTLDLRLSASETKANAKLVLHHVRAALKKLGYDLKDVPDQRQEPVDDLYDVNVPVDGRQ